MSSQAGITCYTHRSCETQHVVQWTLTAQPTALFYGLGKKYLHTAVVKLPPVDPRLLAVVICEAIQCGACLTDKEEVGG
jgi:hypothetical protein